LKRIPGTVGRYKSIGDVLFIWCSGTDTVKGWVDSNDKNVAGEDYSLPRRSLFGVRWDYGSLCGSRGAHSNYSALNLYSYNAGRGVAEPYGGRA
jgi:hypothetical protein